MVRVVVAGNSVGGLDMLASTHAFSRQQAYALAPVRWEGGGEGVSGEGEGGREGGGGDRGEAPPVSLLACPTL